MVSARQLTGEGFLEQLPATPICVILNNFQTATRLTDLTGPVAYVDVSLGVTARVLEALRGRDVRKLIYTSSASVYGNNVLCRENDRAVANSLHSSLKVANEALVSDFGAQFHIDTTIVRLFNMYGGDDCFSVISKIVDAVQSRSPLQVANHGNAVRDFIHVDDVVRSYEAVLRQRDLKVVNVATGLGTSVRSIVEVVRSNGHELEVSSRQREEIGVSIADVSRLAEIADVSTFRRVTNYVVDLIG